MPDSFLGIRVKDDRVVVSDLDVATVTKDGYAIDEKIIKNGFSHNLNQTYGNDVIMHGDNYAGVIKRESGAYRVAMENEIVFVYNKKGSVDSGKYGDMIKKYVRKDNAEYNYNILNKPPKEGLKK
jgi:hypothetical protein